MGQSSVDCGKLSGMPSVSFTIGGKTFDLAPEEVRLMNVYDMQNLLFTLHLGILMFGSSHYI